MALLILALLAATAAAVLLTLDYRRATAHQRERRRWALARGWRYAATDTVLAHRWHRGALTSSDSGRARHVATGRLATAATTRRAHIFDHEREGRLRHTLAAVHCPRTPEGLVVELRLPSEPFPDGAQLELLGPVGGRYAFATDLAAARPLIVPALVANADEIGDDVSVVWLERGWVLAALPPPPGPAAAPGRAAAAPQRLHGLLRVLGAVADDFDAEQGSEHDTVRETAAG